MQLTKEECNYVRNRLSFYIKQTQRHLYLGGEKLSANALNVTQISEIVHKNDNIIQNKVEWIQTMITAIQRRDLGTISDGLELLKNCIEAAEDYDASK